MFGPSGFWTMAPLHYAAKFDPFHPGAIQGKEGIKFCHLATLNTGHCEEDWNLHRAMLFYEG